jgi:hypothetical protein
VASDRPFNVCQLDVERDCQYNSQCAVGQACGIDQRCRDACAADRDCIPGQLCVSGTCADLPELVNGTLPVAKTDAAPPNGQPCVYNSECPSPFICRAGLCAPECLTGVDCSGGRACVDRRCVDAACAGVDAGSGMACTYNSSCPAPLVCRNGACACECIADSDCAAGLACVSHRCQLGTQVGALGGVVRSADGVLELIIAPNALSSPVSFTIEKLEAWPAGALGAVFQVRPTGTTFALPSTVVYHYQTADLGGTPLNRVLLATAIGAAWAPLAAQSSDAAAQTLSAETTHLSVFGLVDDRVVSGTDGGAGGAAGAGTGGSGAGGGPDTGGTSGAGGGSGAGGSSTEAGPPITDASPDTAPRDASTDSGKPQPDASTCISGPRPLTSTMVCVWSLAGLPPFDDQKSTAEATFSDGGVQSWTHVAAAADCGTVQSGFYYDLTAQPPLLLGCPAVCGVIRPDPGASVEFLLECL